jgi:hypothetical protein
MRSETTKQPIPSLVESGDANLVFSLGLKYRPSPNQPVRAKPLQATKVFPGIAPSRLFILWAAGQSFGSASNSRQTPAPLRV